MMSEYLLAIDIATSAAKAVLYNPALEVVELVRRPYTTHYPKPGWSEQDPVEIVAAVTEATAGIVERMPSPADILSVSFSSQMYSILAANEDGSPLTKSIIWSDTRSSAIAEEIRKDPDAPSIYAGTACPIDALYPLSKIGWLKRQGIREKARFVSIKEFVLFHLTGRWVVDWSTASGSGMFDIHQREWNQTALAYLNISPANLSVLVSPRSKITGWKSGFLSATGLTAGTPLVIGGGDGPLANLGVGAIEKGTLAVNVGTSAAARCAVPEVKIDPQGRLWTYTADEELWVMGGMVSSGGGIFRWWAENILGASSSQEATEPSSEHMEAADRLAGEAPPGALGLIFVPYLAGEQCPGWLPSTRGGFFGMGLHHGRSHLSRAVLEGITRSLYLVAAQLARSLGTSFQEIRATGGLVESAVWLQIAADMFGLPVYVPKSPEGSACGAAILAGLAIGLWSTLGDTSGLIHCRGYIHPRPDVHRYYNNQNHWFRDSVRLSREFIKNKEIYP
jgi:gluconokinase